MSITGDLARVNREYPRVKSPLPIPKGREIHKPPTRRNSESPENDRHKSDRALKSMIGRGPRPRPLSSKIASALALSPSMW